VVVDEGRYFAFYPAGSVEAQEIDPRIRKEELRERLIGAVERRLISDVPLGAFLSGGVDSALVVAVIMKDLGRELDTFSIGFADTAESEHEAAREIANHLGTRHHEEILQPDAVDLVQHIAARLDHPNGDSSCLPTYLLSAFARRHVTVAISGDGGDEMFGGYGRYRDTLNEWGDPDQIRRVHGIANPAKASPSDLYMSLRWHIWLPNTVADLLGGMPDGAAERLALWRAWLDRSEQPLMHRMRRVDASFYLPGAVLAKVDRMSMLHSLEVRSPLLDKDVAEFASLLSQQECWTPPDGTKHILKELASDYLPREWMNRPKKGFGLPSNAWSIEQMIGLARDLLLTSDTHLTDLMDRKQLTRLVEAQSTPQTFSIYQIWPLLVLEIWLRHQPGRQMWNKHAPTTGLSSLASRAARWMN
jgi:asparagine synthase (glutamine-hydrolysing)